MQADSIDPEKGNAPVTTTIQNELNLASYVICLYHHTEYRQMDKKVRPRGSKTIVVPFDKKHHETIIDKKVTYRSYLEEQIKLNPNIFPVEIKDGFEFHGFKTSGKLGGRTRQIKLKSNGEVYRICPSYILPYNVGYVKDTWKAILLTCFGVPLWVISLLFGKDDMYWYRIITSLGRNSVVGTTVYEQKKLPKDLLADEKHTKLKGIKVFIATIVGNGCVLCSQVCPGAGVKDLTKGYGVFAEEVRNIDPGYEATSFCIDGWDATWKALKGLFENSILILCFLHGYISIRDRCKKSEMYSEIAEAVWNIYKAPSKRSFMQRARRLREWAEEKLVEGIIKDKVLAFCKKASFYSMTFICLTAHRTSNMIDRVMRRQDRYLFNRQYLHGNMDSAILSMRAWAILKNFQPYCTRISSKNKGQFCAAEILNNHRYSDNWFENLLISASMNGYQ